MNKNDQKYRESLLSRMNPNKRFSVLVEEPPIERKGVYRSHATILGVFSTMGGAIKAIKRHYKSECELWSPEHCEFSEGKNGYSHYKIPKALRAIRIFKARFGINEEEKERYTYNYRITAISMDTYISSELKDYPQ